MPLPSFHQLPIFFVEKKIKKKIMTNFRRLILKILHAQFHPDYQVLFCVCSKNDRRFLMSFTLFYDQSSVPRSMLGTKFPSVGGLFVCSFRSVMPVSSPGNTGFCSTIPMPMQFCQILYNHNTIQYNAICLNIAYNTPQYRLMNV